MIIGTKYWNDPDTYYRQDNNAFESILKKSGVKSWLETCGPTAAVSIIHSLGKLPEKPKYWIPQWEDVLALWFNDPFNTPLLRSIRADINPDSFFNNRVPQFYPEALDDVFGVHAEFAFGISASVIKSHLTHGNGLLLTLKTPGHYVAVVAYDSETDEVIYNDSWPANQWPSYLIGKTGFNRRVKIDEFVSNLQPYRVVIG